MVNSPSWTLFGFLIKNHIPSGIGEKKYLLNWLLPPTRPGIEISISQLVLVHGFDITSSVNDLRELDPLALLDESALAEFKRIIDCVTPALFAVAPKIARRLRAEGVAIEVFFIRWMLDLVWTPRDLIVCILMALEGATSLIWLRIFILHVASLKDEALELERASKELMDLAITPQLLKNASRLDLNKEWMSNWMT